MNVYEAAVQRMVTLYERGDRVVVSLSSGKDSTCCLEVAVEAARRTGRLPVEAVTRDEEILLPGCYEYLERIHERDDVELHWLVANQPIINIFNREQPYWWVFDPLLDPDEWVRQPPPYAQHIPEINIRAMTTPDRFPVEPGQRLVAVIGLRVAESRGRLYGLFSSGSYMTTHPEPGTGVFNCRPIYDWADSDIWRAIHTFGWDYSTAYDTMHRHGIRPVRLRIGPPSMNIHGVEQLKMASQAWPAWWDRVARRLPGMRAAAHFGKRCVEPERRIGESWEATFRRECIERAPAWIAERALEVERQMVIRHSKHSTTPFPERIPCRTCQGTLGSWRTMAQTMYCGDPFSQLATLLPYVEPERFRAGSGYWHGPPG